MLELVGQENPDENFTFSSVRTVSILDKRMGRLEL